MTTATASPKTEQKVGKKDLMERFGVTMAPHKATKVLSRPMGGSHVGALCLIVIHDGKYTGMNAYPNGDGTFRLGAGYDPVHYTYPLTEKAKKKQVRSGYEEEDGVDTARFPFLVKA